MGLEFFCSRQNELVPPETFLKLPCFIDLVGRFTQINQIANCIVISGSHSMYHCLIDLLPALVLVIVNILQMPQMFCSLAFAFLMFSSSFYSLAFRNQRGISDSFTCRRSYSIVIPILFTQLSDE